MAEKDDPDGPSLELPSFGFRRKRRPDPEPAASAEPVTPEPAAAPPAPPAAPEPAPAPSGGTQIFTEEAPAAVESGATTEPVRSTPRRLALPQLGAVPAALTTGLLVGALTVGLVWASQGACEVVRGTSSCGDAGFLLLLAVLVTAGWLGGVLLRAFGVAEAGSTSFLAMGLVAVVLMLFLADELFAWWMVVVVPGVAMVAYVVAHRVSTAMVEPGGREMHR
jgi:hypothetical protein